jgi:hypothetical protein
LLTPKTVEYDRRNTYRKLHDRTPRELAEALSVQAAAYFKKPS